MNKVSWTKLSWFDRYEPIAKIHKEWEIILHAPNGGIIGVSVYSPALNQSYHADTQGFKRFFDDDWHIEKAEEFLNEKTLEEMQCSTPV